jgi:hypothetical protein
MYGFGTASIINSNMNYIMPMARNRRTGETVKAQDLTSSRYQLHQRHDCLLEAQRLARQLTERTGDVWVAVVQPYTPFTRR